MNSLDTSGQMSVQCESMNVSTTVRPRKLASETVRPDWSVSVKPGAATCGTGESCMRLASDVLTLAGTPVGRGGCLVGRSLVTANANTVAKATPASNAATVSRTVERRGNVGRRLGPPPQGFRGAGGVCCGSSLSAEASLFTWSISLIRKAPSGPSEGCRSGYLARFRCGAGAGAAPACIRGPLTAESGDERPPHT